VEDIMHLPVVLEKIIEAGGCVIQDEFLRTGRRYRADDKGDCKNKPRRSGRISTAVLPPVHTDAIPALESLNRSNLFLHLQKTRSDKSPGDDDVASDTSQDTDDDSSDSDNSECTEQPEDNNDLNNDEENEVEESSSAFSGAALP
jgi:hypothetical protein